MMKSNIERYFSSISYKEYNDKHISINSPNISNVFLEIHYLFNKIQNSKRIIDIGSGFFDLERVLKKNFSPYINKVEIIAIDIIDNIYNMLLNDLKKLDLNLKFIKCNANNILISDNTVDLIFLLNVIPYIKGVQRISNEIYRIANKNALVIILNPKESELPLWNLNFNGIKGHFHSNLNNYFNSRNFNLIDKKEIFTNLPYVDIMKLEIANIYVYEVKK